MPRASSSRKRVLQKYKEESSEDENQSEGEPDSGVEEIIGRKLSTKPKNKGKAKQKEPPKAKEKQEEDAMDVDDEEDKTSKAGSSSKPISPPSAAPAKRPRGRPRKSLPAAPETPTPESAVKLPTKRRGRPPKTKATVDDSDAESTRGRRSVNVSPVRSLIERPRTRSISRTRQESSASPGAFRPTHKPKSLNRSKTKLAEVLGGADEGSDSGEADDEQPKKKRKINAA